MKIKLWHVILIILACIFILCALQFYVIHPLKYKNEIQNYSKIYGLNPGLVAALICAESRFNSGAVSPSGAKGLMQIMPSTFDWISAELEVENADIFNPETNIKSGCFYLSYLYQKYNNTIYVLACYNAGENVVSSWGTFDKFNIDDIRYLETKNYVKKILRLERFYNSRF